MTPAEFDTRRRLLGLSVQEVADWCGTDRRTVERWISGYSRILPKSEEKLTALENAMKEGVKRALDFSKVSAKTGIPLIRYRTQASLDASAHAAGIPLGAHAILIGRVADSLDAGGMDVEIVWGD